MHTIPLEVCSRQGALQIRIHPTLPYRGCFLICLSLCSSSCGNLVVPWTRRRIGDRASSVAAPRAWNRLPTELKLLQSTDSFRHDLKTFLFYSFTGTRIRIDSVMRPRSSSRGHTIQVPQL